MSYRCSHAELTESGPELAGAETEMARPAAWTALGSSSDPVPGDPGQVGAQAAHLAAVARQIIEQAGQLRVVERDASGPATAGAYGRKIHAAAGDVAGQLTQTVGRYEQTADALRRWEPIACRYLFTRRYRRRRDARSRPRRTERPGVRRARRDDLGVAGHCGPGWPGRAAQPRAPR